MDNQKRLRGDIWLYIASVLAGMSCLKAAVDDIQNSDGIVRFELSLLAIETEMGEFVVGDELNEYIVNGNFSVINVFYSLCRHNQKGVNLPVIQEMVENCYEMVIETVLFNAHMKY